MKYQRYTSIIFFVSLHWACAGMRTIGSRPLFTQPEALKKIGYPLPDAPNSQAVYVKKNQIEIKEIDQKNHTGSLFNLDDDRNDFYGNLNQDAVGRFVNVAVVLPKIDGKKDEAAAKSADTNKRTPEEEELLKQFPELLPPDEALRVKKSFKMQIMQRLSNGDILALYKRSSDAMDEAKSLSITARIPHSALMKSEGVTTADLSEVHFNQVSPVDSIDRRSSNWEDEYALRMSGFQESRSREAAELARKRKEMNQFRERMLTRLKAFGNERVRTAQERDKLREEKRKDTETISQLQSKVNELDKQVAAEQKAKEAKPTENANAPQTNAAQTSPAKKP